MTEPQIPSIAVAVGSAQIEEMNGVKLYVANTRTPILTVSATDAVSISVIMDNLPVTGTFGVYDLTFADDGYYSLDIEAVGATGDIGYETVNLLIDTAARRLGRYQAAVNAGVQRF